jgi:flagellar hook protein FlgE
MRLASERPWNPDARAPSRAGQGEDVMSLIGTFNTATQALLAQAQHLSNISTNIANVNTNAYKLQRTDFQTLLNHIRPNQQKFFTVDTVDSRDVDRQGIVRSTERKLDLAIQGRGFFVTKTTSDGTGIWQFSRDGAFSGQAVELDSDSDNDGQTDQGALLTTSTGSYVYGWQVDGEGNFDEENSLGALVPLTINSNEVFAHQPTSQMYLQANVSADSNGRQAVGLPFVDNAGNTRTLTIGFNATLTNAWNMDFASIGSNFQTIPVTSTVTAVQFNGSGQLIAPANGLITLTVQDPTGPQTITLDIGDVTQFRGEGEIFVQNSDHNRFLEGRLDDTYFTEDGVLIDSYTNQEVRPLFKLPIATFVAPDNLEARSGNFFTQTIEAGELSLEALDRGPNVAQIFVGGLEASNVDLADQFSKMIITQRAYSSSATVLRTADEMSMQARDLKR